MLCADGARDGSTAGIEQAIFAYNHARWHVSEVMTWTETYAVQDTNSPAALQREIAKAGEHPRVVALPPTWWTSSPPASGSPSRT
jgi:putative NADPH-quinone reductase